MLLITCKKRFKKNRLYCYLNVNMKTGKTIINNNGPDIRYAPHYRYIKKDDKDTYLFNGGLNPIHLIIETFSGNIQVEISPKDAFLYNKLINKEYYVIPDNKNITVTIKGLDNSIYSIYDSGRRDNMSLYFGYNYLVNIKEKNFVPKFMYFPEWYDFILGMTYINCSIKINNTEKIIELNKTKNIYQEFLNIQSIKNYTINKLNNKDENCLVLIYLHKLEKLDSYTIGVPLGNNTSQSFIFNNNNNYILFSYPHTNQENDINITFKILKEGKYNIDIVINNDKIESKNINNSETNISLKADEIKKNAKIINLYAK